MANYFSKYQGRGGPAINPGIVQMMGSIGDEYAKGIEGLAEGIEKYRKNKSELNRAQADFENLSERTDPEIVMYSVDSKRMQKIQDGKGTAEDFLSATNSINAKIEDIEKLKEQDAKAQERKALQAYREATLGQGEAKIDIQRKLAAATTAEAATKLAERDERIIQDTRYLKTEAQLAEISPVRVEQFIPPPIAGEFPLPEGQLPPMRMDANVIDRTPEEMRAEALEIFATNVEGMGVENAGKLIERINKAHPTPLTSNLKVTTLPNGERYIENVKGGGFEAVDAQKAEPATVTTAKIRSEDRAIDRRLDAAKAIDAKIESRKRHIYDIKKESKGVILSGDQEIIDELEAEIKAFETQQNTTQNKFKFNSRTRKIE